MFDKPSNSDVLLTASSNQIFIKVLLWLQYESIKHAFLRNEMYVLWNNIMKIKNIQHVADIKFYVRDTVAFYLEVIVNNDCDWFYTVTY